MAGISRATWFEGCIPEVTDLHGLRVGCREGRVVERVGEPWYAAWEEAPSSPQNAKSDGRIAWESRG